MFWVREVKEERRNIEGRGKMRETPGHEEYVLVEIVAERDGKSLPVWVMRLWLMASREVADLMLARALPPPPPPPPSSAKDPTCVRVCKGREKAR